MNNFPEKKDVLFLEETDFSTGAWIQNPSDKFFLYSEGYKQAAQKLYEECIKENCNANLLVYPLIFNYRHYIELCLKELIIMGYKYIQSAEDFKDEHRLTMLWGIYRNEILPQIFEVEKKILDNVERVIKQFEQVDPRSFSFRYPVTTAPNRKPSLSLNTINLKNFKEIMDKLISFFEFQWDTIANYQDMKNY